MPCSWFLSPNLSYLLELQVWVTIVHVDVLYLWKLRRLTPYFLISRLTILVNAYLSENLVKNWVPDFSKSLFLDTYEKSPLGLNECQAPYEWRFVYVFRGRATERTTKRIFGSPPSLESSTETESLRWSSAALFSLKEWRNVNAGIAWIVHFRAFRAGKIVNSVQISNCSYFLLSQC